MTLRPGRGELLSIPGPRYGIPSRGIGMIIARVIRGALKIRYIVLGGTIAGGSALAKVSFINLGTIFFDVWRVR